MELSSILLQFEQTQEQILNLLNGRPYSPEVLDPQDPMARKTVAAALIEGMTSEGAESQRRAREAFIRHGYLSEASERLLTALSPAERSESATQIGIAGDPTMLDSLFSVLEDGSREVRRAAIEAIRKIGDPV